MINRIILINSVLCLLLGLSAIFAEKPTTPHPLQHMVVIRADLDPKTYEAIVNEWHRAGAE